MNHLLPYFQVLEIRPGASLEEIRKSYHRLVKIWHPDRFPRDDKPVQQKALRKVQEINEAYSKICDYYKKVGEEAARQSYAGSAGPTRKTYDWGDNFDPQTATARPRTSRRPQPVLRSMRSLYTLYIYGMSLLLICLFVSFFFFSNFISENNPYSPFFNTEWAENATSIAAEEDPQENSQMASSDPFSTAAVSTPNRQTLPPSPPGSALAPPEKHTPGQAESFTIGSSANTVWQAQGKPDKITREFYWDYEIWHYGSSTVTLSRQDQKVTGWDNRGRNLSNYLSVTGSSTEPQIISYGSHKDDVLRVQGKPDKITQYPASGYEVWRYGYSSVIFSIRSDKVIQWVNSNNNLNVGGREPSVPILDEMRVN